MPKSSAIPVGPWMMIATASFFCVLCRLEGVLYIARCRLLKIKSCPALKLYVIYPLASLCNLCFLVIWYNCVAVVLITGLDSNFRSNLFYQDCCVYFKNIINTFLVMKLSRSGWWLDLILKVFSSLEDSKFLWCEDYDCFSLLHLHKRGVLSICLKRRSRVKKTELRNFMRTWMNSQWVKTRLYIHMYMYSCPESPLRCCYCLNATIVLKWINLHLLVVEGSAVSYFLSLS